MKNILYDIYKRGLVPVYRFANEGFKNYNQERLYTIDLNGNKKDIIGCYVSMCGVIDKFYLLYEKNGHNIDRSYDDIYIGAIPRESKVIYEGLDSNYYYKKYENIDIHDMTILYKDRYPDFYTDAGKCLDYLKSDNESNFEYYNNSTDKYYKSPYYKFRADINPASYALTTEYTSCIIDANDIVEIYKVNSHDLHNLFQMKMVDKLGFFDLIDIDLLYIFGKYSEDKIMTEKIKIFNENLSRHYDYSETYEDYLNYIRSKCNERYEIEKI